jgi:hypothetical protein
VTFDPLAILRVLNQHEVRYAVVGGFAVATHGVIRATEDLDLVTDRGMKNAERLVAALDDLEAQGREPVSPEVIVRRVDLRYETKFGEIHLLRSVGGVPSYSELEKELAQIDDVTFEVATKEAVREMKTAAGRNKDRFDLDELDAIDRAESAKPADPETS